MFLEIIFIVVGFALLVVAADFFVHGSLLLGKKLGVSEMLIGLTIVALGTSLPELFVNILSFERNLDSALIGNVVGSNVFNIAFILGIQLLLRPIANLSNTTKRFDIPVALLFVVLMLVFGNDLSKIFFQSTEAENPTEGILNRFEGVILITAYVLFIVVSYFKSKKNPSTVVDVVKEIVHEIVVEDQQANSPKTKKNNFKAVLDAIGVIRHNYILAILLGLAGLYFGSEITVTNTVALATRLGLSELFIGVFILAVGTSLPELITSLVAIKKNYEDIAVGNIIGSNICNIGLLIGLFPVLRPLGYDLEFNFSLYVLFGIGLYLMLWVLIFPNNKNRSALGRIDGLLLLSAYVCYSIVQNL